MEVLLAPEPGTVHSETVALLTDLLGFAAPSAAIRRFQPIRET